MHRKVVNINSYHWQGQTQTLTSNDLGNQNDWTSNAVDTYKYNAVSKEDHFADYFHMLYITGLKKKSKGNTIRSILILL